MLPERIERGLRQFDAREADGCERGQRELGESDVVEADDGEILRNAEALKVGSAQHSDGRHVIRTDDCRGLGTEILQLIEPGDATLEGVIALNDPLLLDGQFAFLHRGLEVVLAGDGGV
jgi:hypothetical protein